MLGIALLAISPAVNGQATLVQTIDLKNWAGVPVTIVQPPPPQPAAGFSITSMAFNPSNQTLYVADYATTNVYAIDSVTNTVQSAVYTNGLFSTADIGATQALPGTFPKVVLANPKTNRWIFLGQGGGAEFSGTTFAEAINARAFQNGGAWDPVTDNVYGADGLDFFAVNNLKFLYASVAACNAAAVNTANSRLYVLCGGSVTAFDGIALSKANVKTPTAPLGGIAIPGAQPTGLAVNPNTNRVYVAGLTSPTSLDILDGSTYQIIASIPGLPDQSKDCMIAGYMCLSLPRPVAVNATTNAVFVVNSVSSTVSVFDGNTNALVDTIVIPVPPDAVVSQPFQPNTQLFETKPGNTIFDASASAITTLGGAISIAVNEATDSIYVASVNGTISVYALPAAPPAFNSPIVPRSYSLSPWTMIGGGVTTTAAVTLTQPAPAGGAVLTLSVSDPKSAKSPSTVTVPAGQSSVSFAVQGSGVSATTSVTLTAQYNGGTASTALIVAPGDKVTITSATYSQSTQLLSVSATGTNPQATLQVFLASNNQLLGTMVNQGGGNYTLQVGFPSGIPSSINVISNLGAKTGQGVALVP